MNIIRSITRFFKDRKVALSQKIAAAWLLGLALPAAYILFWMLWSLAETVGFVVLAGLCVTAWALAILEDYLRG